MERLIRPIEAVIRHCRHEDWSGRLSYACCALLLKEMHARQTTLWAWDTKLWLETVGTTQHDFTHRHGDFHAERQLPRLNPRHQLINCAYLLGDVAIHRFITDCQLVASARSIFGHERVRATQDAVGAKLAEVGIKHLNISGLRGCTAWALLLNRSCVLKELTREVLEEVYQLSAPFKGLQQGCLALGQALQRAGILSQPLSAAPPPAPPRPAPRPKPTDTLPVAWKELIETWSKLTYGQARTVRSQRSRIAKAGRWAAAVFPRAAKPDQWTAGMAKAFVEAVRTMKVGDWNHGHTPRKGTRWGEALRPAVQVQIIQAVRCFFTLCKATATEHSLAACTTECQATRLLPDAFEPAIFLKTPSDLLAACGPDPKVIDWDTWTRLEQAGLSLTQADLPRPAELPKGYHAETTYPLELVRALAAVWLFAGLRRDEIRRLPIGCTQFLPALQHPTHPAAGPARRIVNLRVPANKSGGPFDKAVDVRLAPALKAWERRRRALLSPQEQQPELLFVWQGRPLSVNYLNQVLIPLLCRKAGLSNYDARGRITCHRGRATLATQLYQIGVPLRHVQHWLGHQSPRSLVYYLQTDEAIVPETVRDALQAKRIQQLSPHLPVPAFVAVPPESAPVEPVATLGPLDHLRFDPRETNQSLALTARNSLAQVQEQMLLTAAERHALMHAMELLGTIAVRM
ncbi:MAG: tyrosine-type recombinase/integrase [Janthinobacterium lividum]